MHGLVSMDKGIESVQHVQDMLSVIVTDLQRARFEQIGIIIHSRRQKAHLVGCELKKS